MDIYTSSVEKPTFIYESREQYFKEVEAYEKAVRAEIDSDHPYAGKIYAVPYADGFARYMIVDENSLIHLEDGDAWHDPATSHMTFSEVKSWVDFTEGLAK